MTKRRTHCKRGHVLTGDNVIYRNPDGVKPRASCRICHDARRKRYAMERAHGPSDMSPPNPTGFCFCGCGQITSFSTMNSPWLGLVKGEHMRYKRGHPQRNRAVLMSDYHKTKILTGSSRPVHVAIVEQLLGKRLRKGVQVHHVNEDKLDNRRENLVVCENQSYHRLLHRRRKALLACGHPDWLTCSFCKQWDAPTNLKDRGRGWHHARCANDYSRVRRLQQYERRRAELGVL